MKNKIRSYSDLQSRLTDLNNEKYKIEANLQIHFHDSLSSKNWLILGARFLSTSFKDIQSNPYVSLAQGAFYLYRQYKQGNLSPNQTVLEHLLDLLTEYQSKKSGSKN